MTEKRQTSQGYIIRILQHFATKLWNITNFVMLFQAVMKFLSRLVEIKILSVTQMVNWLICMILGMLLY
jgi:valyl-tRNA synthetase